MNSAQSSFLIFFALLTLSGCRQEAEDSFTSDAQTDALESAVTMIAGQADDASGATYAMQTKSNSWKYAYAQSLAYSLAPSSAGAANCGRAFDQACNVGVKTATYTACSIPSRGFTLSGDVTLTYSNNSCSLGIGESVTRTYNHTIQGPRGGAIQTTSELRTDYRGTQISGGGQLSHTSATVWTMNLLGKHKIGTRNGRTLFDVSARSTTPISISNSLTRSGRTVSSGAVEVNHNLAKFTATFTANSNQPLVWNSLCCHPVSGQLDATYTGTLSGNGTITFNGCGTAQLSKDGSTRTLSLGYCE